MVVKFRFRDLKWEVMKARKGLKGTKLSFHEDMCKEYQQLEREVRDENAVKLNQGDYDKINNEIELQKPESLV